MPVADTSQLVSGVAERYASSLFDLAQEAGSADSVGADLARFQAMIDESDDLKRLIASPVFSAEDQTKAIAAVAAKAGITGLVANFLKVVASNRRLFAVPGMIKAYRAIAADADMAPELRNVATLLAGLHDIDSSDPVRLEQQLAALSVANSPWRHSALELAAIAAARAGDAAKAREYYTRIVDDPTAPPGLRARASEMLAALSG